VTTRISLALALHNHQPVGNFGWVIAEVYEQAYLPMVDALERHPSVRVALHYSGPLLDWLRVERPPFVARLRVLADRGQVEIMGGGAAEPILVSLPERDRVGQLRRMGDEVEATFGTRPTGAWLAERVWEPDLPTSLLAGGYQWTILDDAHFRAAAIAEDDLWGPYITEDQGRVVTVFGTEQGLRYRIPWRNVEEVIEYLRAHATEDGSRVGTMGDDGEKFGAWPTTWAHCWGESDWVERFFAALESNADWLSTVTPSGWLAEHPPIGRVYVPTGSYAEMGEWALPADEAAAFADVVHAAKVEHRPELRWLRGASWRNYQVKYREINDLHKQMLRVSDKVDAMAPGPARDRATRHLYQGQSNDCYWHGLFGGVYISHMRLATHEHLIAAEDLADAAAGLLESASLLDLDLDGADDVRLSTAGQVVTVDLEDGAGIGDWDVRAARHAVTAVLRRRPEAYHARIASDEAAGIGDGSAAASIHDGVRAKESGLADHLVYDTHERRSGLVRVLPADVTVEDWASARTTDLADAVDGAFELVELGPGRCVVGRETSAGDEGRLRVTKRLVLAGGRLDPSLALEVEVENTGDAPIAARIAVEWTTTMLGGGANPAAWWEVDGERTPHDGDGSAEALTALAQGNDDIGIAIETNVSPAADAWWASVETISNSEGGVERSYQGSGLLLSWPVALAPGERWSASVANAVTVAIDRAEEG
jgi:4-alpha-glucanotransferase